MATKKTKTRRRKVRDSRRRGRPQTDRRMPEPSPLLVLAESGATQREVIRQLERQIERIYNSKRINTRSELIKRLHMWLDEHTFSNFSRKKTVEKVVAQFLRRNGGAFHRWPVW